MFLKRFQSQQIGCVVQIDVWMQVRVLFYIYAHLCIVFSIEMFIISHEYFASDTLRNVLESNQANKWIVIDHLLPNNWKKKRPTCRIPTTLCQSNSCCIIWLCLKMHRVIYWLHPTRSIQINIVIGGKPPSKAPFKIIFHKSVRSQKFGGWFCSFTEKLVWLDEEGWWS